LTPPIGRVSQVSTWWRNLREVPDSFFKPLPDDELDAFEGIDPD
jgi:hypothetical protein